LIWKGPMYINVLVGAIEKQDMNEKSTATWSVLIVWETKVVILFWHQMKAWTVLKTKVFSFVKC
jgi:hypothetical protein